MSDPVFNTATCQLCGVDFCYIEGSARQKKLCPECYRNKRQEYHRQYYEANKAKFRDNYKHRRVEHKRSAELQAPQPIIEETICNKCGRRFSYEYKGTNLRTVCDECLVCRNSAEISVYNKSAAEKNKLFEQYTKRATELHLTYGKFVIALERGLVMLSENECPKRGLEEYHEK